MVPLSPMLPLAAKKIMVSWLPLVKMVKMATNSTIGFTNVAIGRTLEAHHISDITLQKTYNNGR